MFNKAGKRKHEKSKQESRRHQKRVRKEERSLHLTKFIESIQNENESAVLKNFIPSSHASVMDTLNKLCNGENTDLKTVPFKHFGNLSLGTELESTFLPECMTIKSTHIRSLQSWMQEKPLDKLIVGKLGYVVTLEPIKSCKTVNSIMKECLEEFNEDMFHMMGGGTPQPNPDYLYPVPKCLSENTVNKVNEFILCTINFNRLITNFIYKQ